MAVRRDSLIHFSVNRVQGDRQGTNVGFESARRYAYSQARTLQSKSRDVKEELTIVEPPRLE